MVPGEPDELLRVVKRQWPQQQRIEHDEDDDARSDAERQDEHGHRRKDRVTPQRAQRVPHVLPQHLERRDAARLPMPLFRLRDSAEPDERLPPRLLGRHAVPDVLLGCHLEVRGHLGVEVPVERHRGPQGAQTVQRAPQPGDHRSRPGAASTRPMTAASRSQ